MKKAVVFPLKTSTVFSKAPKDTFASLDRLIKNSLLFFEEIWFEAGAYCVTYGDTHASNFNLPYKGVEDYKKFKTGYEMIGVEKQEAYIAVGPEGVPHPERHIVVASPARSYYISLQGALECLLENYSKKELDFIKYIWAKRPVDNIVQQTVTKIKRNIPNITNGLRQICHNWDIGIICYNLILREAINAILLSKACNAPPIVDEIHKDVIGLVDNSRRELRTEQLRIDAISKVMQIAVPDYSSLTIEKILDLRNEPSIKEFRKAIFEISTKLVEISDKEIDLVISQEISKRLIKDMKDIAPKSRRKIILSATVDVIPELPFPSQFNIPILAAELGMIAFKTIGDIRKTEKWKNSFGYFWVELS